MAPAQLLAALSQTLIQGLRIGGALDVGDAELVEAAVEGVRDAADMPADAEKRPLGGSTSCCAR